VNAVNNAEVENLIIRIAIGELLSMRAYLNKANINVLSDAESDRIDKVWSDLEAVLTPHAE
jgi:hypothetical protein